MSVRRSVRRWIFRPPSARSLRRRRNSRGRRRCDLRVRRAARNLRAPATERLEEDIVRMIRKRCSRSSVRSGPARRSRRGPGSGWPSTMAELPRASGDRRCDSSEKHLRDHQLRFDLPPGVVGDATSFRARVGLVERATIGSTGYRGACRSWKTISSPSTTYRPGSSESRIDS